MGVFEYEAMAKSGKNVRGVIDADTPAAARRKLREQDLYPTKLSQSNTKAAAGAQAPEERGTLTARVSQRDLSLMTRQLAVLTQAGMPLVEALGALMDQTANPRLRKIIFDVRDKVNEGITLGDALSAHKRIFSELYINMVRAGEQSGALETVLFRIADITERGDRLKRKVTSMLAYPILMALVGLSIVTFMMTFVVPKIVKIFTTQKRELPFITTFMINTSQFIRDWWFLILAGFIAVFVLWRFWVSRPEGRMRWDKIKMRAAAVWAALRQDDQRAFCAHPGHHAAKRTHHDDRARRGENQCCRTGSSKASMDDVKSGVRRGRDLDDSACRKPASSRPCSFT